MNQKWGETTLILGLECSLAADTNQPANRPGVEFSGQSVFPIPRTRQCEERPGLVGRSCGIRTAPNCRRDSVRYLGRSTEQTDE